MQWFFNEFWQIKWDLQESRLSSQHEKIGCRVNPAYREKVMFLKIFWLFVKGEANAVSEEMMAPWFETGLPTVLSNYFLADINNPDEYGLFYQALLSQTMHFKKKKSVDGKFSKKRLTGLASINALRQKLPMFIIGTTIIQDASKI